MKVERLDLGKGVYLNLIECDKFKTNCISVGFIAPVCEKTLAENTILPFVLQRGTSTLPDIACLTRELDMLYGSRIVPEIARFASKQYFGFSSFPLRTEYTDGIDTTARVLSLMLEMIYSPYLENGMLSGDYTESEKRIMTDRIRAQINNKGQYALTRCKEAMFEGDPYALPETGTEEQVSLITPESLTKRLCEVRSSLSCEIYCVGSFDKDTLISAVMSGIDFEKRKEPAPISSENTFATHGIRYVTEYDELSQGKLCVGFRTKALEDKTLLPVYSLFIEVLSSSPTAKLFINVREKKSLCYYCSALSDTLKGVMIVTSGIDEKDRDEAEKAIFKEISDCADGIISDKELSSARSSLKTALLSVYDDPGAIRAWYIRQRNDGTDISPEEYLKRAETVSKEDIADIAAGLISDTVYFLCKEKSETDQL